MKFEFFDDQSKNLFNFFFIQNSSFFAWFSASFSIITKFRFLILNFFMRKKNEISTSISNIYINQCFFIAIFTSKQLISLKNFVLKFLFKFFSFCFNFFFMTLIHSYNEKQNISINLFFILFFQVCNDDFFLNVNFDIYKNQLFRFVFVFYKISWIVFE